MEVNVSNELKGYNREHAFIQVKGIYEIFLRTNNAFFTNLGIGSLVEVSLDKNRELSSFYFPDEII